MIVQVWVIIINITVYTNSTQCILTLPAHRPVITHSILSPQSRKRLSTVLNAKWLYTALCRDAWIQAYVSFCHVTHVAAFKQ